jgi:lipopolysaccharide/colanic/teichoic acid biosynthesis glycosyltransferase
MEEEFINVDLVSSLSFEKQGTLLDDWIIRFADIFGALFCLVILAPILPLIALLIRLDSRGSPIFRQKRAGKNGVVFTMHKFRTMCDGADKSPHHFRNEDEPVVKIVDDSRITRIGSILRRCSIDELPQIINILKGDMSFVGPRPPVLEEFSAYSEYQKRRLAGRPGLTGLAQINGRSDLDFDSIVRLDIYYNNNRSAHLYFKILFRTIPYCLSGKSSY